MKEKSKVVTGYELITMMNKGEIPKKVIYDGIVYEYTGRNYYSEETNTYLFHTIIENNDDCNFGSINVVIFEEDENKWNDIDKLDIEDDGSKYFIRDEYGYKCYLTKHSRMIANKINKLIENQEYIKSRLDNIKDEVVFDYWKDKVVGKND